MAAKTALARAMEALEKRATRGIGHVDPEHLVPLAKVGDRATAAWLRELSARYGWPMKKRGSTPLGAWAASVALVLEGGPKRLARAVRAGDIDGDVALGVLEELDGDATIEACVAIGQMPALAASAVDALREGVDRRGEPMTSAIAAKIRRLGHGELAATRTRGSGGRSRSAELASAYCSWRRWATRRPSRR